jgi:phosphoserine phosphatase RsbU/P
VVELDAAEVMGYLLDGAHLAPPDALPRVVSEAARRAGCSIEIFVADYAQETLRALGDDAAPGEEHSIDGSLAGRCFRQSAPVLVGQKRNDTWVPLIDGVDRLGVLRVQLPAGADVGEPRTAAAVRRMAYLVGHLVASKSPYADHLHRARMNRPRSLESELIWSLLPPLTVACRGLAIAAGLEPSHALAGDVFDYSIDGDTAKLAIADATGHDLEAALIGALVLAAYRASRRAMRNLEETVPMIDSALAAHAADAYATGVMAELDLSSGTLRYINAGHPAPLLLRAGKVVRQLDGGRRPLFGLARPCEPATEHLEAGDWVVFYTDGVTEARDDQRRHFGLDRLVDVVERCAADRQNASETLRRVIKAVLNHQRNVLQDDATLLVVQWSSGLEEQLTAD